MVESPLMAGIGPLQIATEELPRMGERQAAADRLRAIEIDDERVPTSLAR